MLPGKININRTSSNQEDDYISISIVDESSHVQFVDVKMSLLAFANAITGMGFNSCDFELRCPELVGMKRERKEELLPRPKFQDTIEDLQKILNPFEVDGWIGSLYDMTNHHYWVGDNQVKVGFTRHVPSDKKNEDEDDS